MHATPVRAVIFDWDHCLNINSSSALLAAAISFQLGFAEAIVTTFPSLSGGFMWIGIITTTSGVLLTKADIAQTTTETSPSVSIG